VSVFGGSFAQQLLLQALFLKLPEEEDAESYAHGYRYSGHDHATDEHPQSQAFVHGRLFR
jgi:hypothetical protein